MRSGIALLSLVAHFICVISAQNASTPFPSRQPSPTPPALRIHLRLIFRWTKSARSTRDILEVQSRVQTPEDDVFFAIESPFATRAKLTLDGNDIEDLLGYSVTFDTDAEEELGIVPPLYPCSPAKEGVNMELFPHVGWANAVPDAQTIIELDIQVNRTSNWEISLSITPSRAVTGVGSDPEGFNITIDLGDREVFQATAMGEHVLLDEEEVYLRWCIPE
ncbi:hypothetical protein BT96DRAFT_1083528 [Gymnopus androsaceus JB14]|uniref:Uncharacterized protein n=1 Tax=Gymnopus androsaceus JB14 TaxID=1447944 RepID=A0A6A4GMU9_9AGAR|nr:hypothetical protein BT96DRAFT_1083528 [Gymnopus androsaceus JB14]